MHTFHLLVGELTLDPIAFTAITGVACAEDLVPFDRRLAWMTPMHIAYIKHLLGIVSTIKGIYTFKFDSIHTYYSDISTEDITTPR